MMSEWVNLNNYDHTVGVWTYDRSSIHAFLDSLSCFGILVFDHSYHFALALEAGKQKCRSLSLLFALTLV